MASEWVLPVLPLKDFASIAAAVEVCRGDFITAESADDVALCIRFHSRARACFEGIDPGDIWRAIEIDRIENPAAWASWRRYWDNALAAAKARNAEVAR